MTVPVRKQPKELIRAEVGTDERAERGRRGFTMKGARGMVNWRIERRRRYPAIGSHRIGTTHHTVREVI